MGSLPLGTGMGMGIGARALAVKAYIHARVGFGD